MVTPPKILPKRSSVSANRVCNGWSDGAASASGRIVATAAFAELEAALHIAVSNLDVGQQQKRSRLDLAGRNFVLVGRAHLGREIERFVRGYARAIRVASLLVYAADPQQTVSECNHRICVGARCKDLSGPRDTCLSEFERSREIADRRIVDGELPLHEDAALSKVEVVRRGCDKTLNDALGRVEDATHRSGRHAFDRTQALRDVDDETVRRVASDPVALLRSGRLPLGDQTEHGGRNGDQREYAGRRSNDARELPRIAGLCRGAFGLRLGSGELVGARLLALGDRRGVTRTTALDIGAIALVELSRQIGARVQRARFGQPQALVREPSLGHAIGFPVSRSTPNAFERRQQSKILGDPSFQQSPLPQQGLVGRLDRRDASDRSCLVFADHVCVSGQEALFDE